ncbi:MAG: mechanosensitive ion channel family protein, partial [Planctomycetota bacterium]
MPDSILLIPEQPWLRRALALLTGLLLGWIAEWVVSRLRGAARKTDWRWDDALLHSIRHLPLLWFSLAGLYWALAIGPVGADWAPFEAAARRILSLIFSSSLVLVGIRVAGDAVRRFSEREENPLPAASLVANTAQILVALLGLFLILQSQGVRITPLLTALGVGGLAVALALQDTLGNLFAGIQLILTRQVSPGDFIRLQSGEEGTVSDVRWRNTAIRTYPDENQVIVPNSILAGSVLKNFTLPLHRMWVTIPVGVSYSSDLERVERVSLEVADAIATRVRGAPPESPAVLRYSAFGESSIDFEIRILCRDFPEQMLLRHEFMKALHARFLAEGIVIPFPIRTLELGE